jgi:hypothetical protein
MWYRAAIFEKLFGPSAISWVQIPNAEIHGKVTVRATWSDSAPKLARELSPGDIEDFGKNPAVRKATIDRKGWYGISLRNLDNEIYLAEADASSALVEWKKIAGCLRATQPQTEAFTATLKQPALDYYPVGFIPMTELQTATLADVIWFRFKNNDSKFRYLSSSRVERLGPENCPTS